MANMSALSVAGKQMKRVEAIVLPMTLVSVTEVNDLLKRFSEMRKRMKNMGKMKKMMARAGGPNFGIR